MLLFQTRAEESLVVRIGKQARPDVERRTLHHIVLIKEMLEFHKTRLTEPFADVRASVATPRQLHCLGRRPGRSSQGFARESGGHPWSISPSTRSLSIRVGRSV